VLEDESITCHCGGVGGVGVFFYGARSTWLALCHARSFYGCGVCVLYMMASSPVANGNYSFCVSTSSTQEKVFIMVGKPSVVVPSKTT
jgi:hypothetical protein